VKFKYFPRKKNVVVNAFANLDIDDMKIEGEHVLSFLPESEIINIHIL